MLTLREKEKSVHMDTQRVSERHCTRRRERERESTWSSTDRLPPNTTAAAAVLSLSLSLIFWCLLLHQHPHHYPGSFSVVVTLPKNSSGALRSLRSTFSHFCLALQSAPIVCTHTHCLFLPLPPSCLFLLLLDSAADAVADTRIGSSSSSSSHHSQLEERKGRERLPVRLLND